MFEQILTVRPPSNITSGGIGNRPSSIHHLAIQSPKLTRRPKITRDPVPLPESRFPSSFSFSSSSSSPCPSQVNHLSTIPSTTSTTTSISTIGAAGAVGSTIAYHMLLNPLSSTLILSDPNSKVLHGQAADLRDAILQSDTTSTRIHVAENPSEAGQADVIIIAAGAAQAKGETRTDLVGKNARILKSVVDGLGGKGKVKKDAIVLVVANPVDAMTYFAQQFLDFLPAGQIFGAGIFLDSARLKGKIAEEVGVSQSNVEAFVLGEHGDSQVVAWSAISVGGVALDRIGVEVDREKVGEETRRKAGEIIEAKGTTNFGIGAVTASICKAILFDQKVIRPVSHWQEEFGVCLSLPAVLGRGGVEGTVELPLSDEEKENLRKSAKSLREVSEEAKKALEE